MEAMTGVEPQTMEQWGIAIGILLGAERARRFADLVMDEFRGEVRHRLVDGLLFSAAHEGRLK